MRTLRGILFVVLGAVLIAVALLVPSYLRAVDGTVLARAGQGTPGLLQDASGALQLNKLGEARLLAVAAQTADVPKANTALAAVDNAIHRDPTSGRWGVADPLLTQLFGAHPGGSAQQSALDMVLPAAHRAALLKFLQTSRRADVQEILGNRDLTRTVIFPPVASPAGQALDSAILLTGLLLQADQLTPSLGQEIEGMAAAANRGYDSSPIEIFYLNLNSLATRLDWGQLTAFLKRVPDAPTLRDLVRVGTDHGDHLPIVFAALHFTGEPTAVARYLRSFPKTGLKNLTATLRSGSGAVKALIQRHEMVYNSRFRQAMSQVPGLGWLCGVLVNLTFRTSLLALFLKYLLWFDGAFCLTRAFANLRPAPSAFQRTLEVQGIGTLRQQLVAGLVVVLAVALGEPYLTHQQAPVLQAAMWHFPTVNPPLLAQVTPSTTTHVMNNNENNLVALAVFFIVQLVVYIVGLIKLREIKRQEIPSPLKLQVLDNEENLFDTGLYVGLGGTGLSLVLMALNLFNASPMIAYASTGFGVFFASVLKIIHVRAYRRDLLIQAAIESAQPVP